MTSCYTKSSRLQEIKEHVQEEQLNKNPALYKSIFKDILQHYETDEHQSYNWYKINVKVPYEYLIESLELKNFTFISIKGWCKHFIFSRQDLSTEIPSKILNHVGKRSPAYIFEEACHKLNSECLTINIKLEQEDCINMLIKLLFLTNNSIIYYNTIDRLYNYINHGH